MSNRVLSPRFYSIFKVFVATVLLLGSDLSIAQEGLIVREPPIAELNAYDTRSQKNFIRGKNSMTDSAVDCSLLTSERDSMIRATYKRSTVDNLLKSLCTDDVNLVIMSENHYQPRSRALLIDNLATLRKLGFTYLFLEALNYDDIELNERGFPLMKSGRYLNDPIHGELIRIAHQLGFKIYPYEQKPEQRGFGRSKIKKFLHDERQYYEENGMKYDESRNVYESNRVFQDMSARDYVQYRNIINFMDGDSTKSVILCGHGHGMKSRYGGWMSMGWWFDENESYNMVSIDCSSIAALEGTSYHDTLTCLYDTAVPYGLQIGKDSFYNQQRYQPYAQGYVSGLFDATIFYPKDFEKGDWASLNRRKKIPLSIHEFPEPPFELQIFKKAEVDYEQPVPIDRLYVSEKRNDLFYYGYGDEEIRVIKE